INDDGYAARQSVGADARYRLAKPVTLSGYIYWSTLELRLAEANGQAAWQIIPDIELRVDYRRTATDLFIPRTSIFSVFSQETQEDGGGEGYWRALRRIRLQVDGHAVSIEEGIGGRAGVRVTALLGASYQGTVGVEGKVLDLPTNGYEQGRVFGIYRITEK